ncbi:hypothetical protein RJ639_014807 [Escallonia herrerae]|uniref:Retrotransposon gag domain-containing protein n=1 Tax=Escallonia herrerae TaxID=1293975 RepID=A0AA88VIT9_9ASTE|nr:hypothetical protein RJ639_014807 [Escallonia herrerae]
MVTSWLIHSTIPAIANSILWTTIASDVWVDLHDRFSQKNAPRIFEIRRAISNNAQNTDSVSTYYTTLKAYSDELSSYRTPPTCTCGAMKTHTDFLENDALMDFLQGLNESYASVRSQILLMDPLPSMAKAYSLILQEERQRSLHDSQQILPSPAAMATTHKLPNSSSRPTARQDNSNRPRYHCNYCDMDGHSDSRCFKQHGYPPRTNDNGSNRGSRSHYQSVTRGPTRQASRGSAPIFGNPSQSNAMAYDEPTSSVSAPSLTADQIQQLLMLLPTGNPHPLANVAAETESTSPRPTSPILNQLPVTPFPLSPPSDTHSTPMSPAPNDPVISIGRPSYLKDYYVSIAHSNSSSSTRQVMAEFTLGHSPNVAHNHDQEPGPSNLSLTQSSYLATTQIASTDSGPFPCPDMKLALYPNSHPSNPSVVTPSSSSRPTFHYDANPAFPPATSPLAAEPAQSLLPHPSFLTLLIFHTPLL